MRLPDLVCSLAAVWAVSVGGGVGLGQSAVELEQLAEELRVKSGVPAVWLARGEVEGRLEVAATGLRSANASVAVTPRDRLHLGSCTKAMTAVLIARLVERGALRWSDSFASVAPGLSRQMPESHREVNLEQLLQHRSGFPENARDWLLQKGVFVTDFRREILLDSLRGVPLDAPGSKERYSNLGYLGAGLIAEYRTGRSWEDLLQAEVFRPLGLDSAGFGPPSLLESLEQPWGHAMLEGRLVSAQADNPPALGPAGAVHMSLQDWFKFCQLFADGGPPGYLTEQTRAKLVEPDLNGEYAYGWVTFAAEWAEGRVITHTGSNNWWLAEATVLPERRLILLCVFNRGGEEAAELATEARRQMLELRRGNR